MKRILVVGATSAIAIACSRLWAPQGARFALIARNAERLRQVALDLRARGAEDVVIFTLDVNEFGAHAETLGRCHAALKEIDIALVAHGTLPDQAACEASGAATIQEFSTNGLSVIAILVELSKHMELQQHGTVAVISSVAGDRGRGSNYVYGSAKAAVTAFCEGLRARLLRAGVHVLTIKPGFVDTPMTSGLKLPRALMTSPDRVATDILRGIDRGKDTLYTPWYWSWIMLLIRAIPSGLFKRTKL